MKSETNKEINKINIIPKTEEKFISDDFNNLIFLDTIALMYKIYF